MFHKFAFRNFRSFASEAIIDFTVGKKGTDNDWYFDSALGYRLNKVITFIGPNASGKTSVLQAMAFLRWFITSSFTSQKGESEEMPLDQFAFKKESNVPSEFEVIFESSNTLYKYSLSLLPNRVEKEIISKKTGSFFSYLLKREWNDEKGIYDLRQHSGLGLELRVLQNILRKNVSVLSSAEALNNQTINSIVQYWRKIKTNVNRHGKSWVTAVVDESQLIWAAEMYAKESKLFEQALTILKSLDLGLSKIHLKKVDIKKGGTAETIETVFPYGVHFVGSETFNLPMYFESSGTQNLFVLLQHLLPVLRSGGCAVIDEMEVDLHPHMIPPILHLFSQKPTNPFNAQIIFTCHSLEVLKFLEKDQIVLVQKNEKCESDIFRLDEMAGIRRDENLYAKYNAGAYGAVPNI